MPQRWDISQITYIFITFWRPKVKLFLALVSRIYRFLSPCREIGYPAAAVPGRLQVVATGLWDIQVDGPDIPLLVIGSMVGYAAIARIELVINDQISFMGIEAEPERVDIANYAPL